MGRLPVQTRERLRAAVLRAFLALPPGSKFKSIAHLAGCSASFAHHILTDEGVHLAIVTPLERAALAHMRKETLANHFAPSPAPLTHG